MFKRNFFISIFFLFFFSLFASNIKQISFNIQPLFGIINGSIEEAVYKKIGDESLYLSRLDWDVKNIPYWGADIKITSSKYLNFEFNLIQGISCVSGNMQDYDWADTLAPDKLTHYSCHTNTIDKFSKIRAGLSGNIFIGKYFILSPGIFMNEEYFAFTGSDGYRTYESENWEVKYFEGDVINYKQKTENLLFALSGLFGKVDKYYGLLSFAIGPKTNIEACDTHIKKDELFNDKIYSCLYFESSLSGQFFFTKNFGIGGKFYIQYLPNSYGNTWFTKTEGKNWNKLSTLGATKRLLYYAQINASLKF